MPLIRSLHGQRVLDAIAKERLPAGVAQWPDTIFIRPFSGIQQVQRQVNLIAQNLDNEIHNNSSNDESRDSNNVQIEGSDVENLKRR